VVIETAVVPALNAQKIPDCSPGTTSPCSLTCSPCAFSAKRPLGSSSPLLLRGSSGTGSLSAPSWTCRGFSESDSCSTNAPMSGREDVKV